MRRPLPSEILEFQQNYICAKGQAQAVRAGGSLARAFAVVPGETARCLVGGKKKGAREAWLQSIIKPSPDRRAPVCPHFGMCGGCALQHMDYLAQIRVKAQPIIDQLRQLDSDFELLPHVAAPSPWYYRGKVEMSFIRDRLGFNRRGRFDHLVDVQECFIGPRVNGLILKTVRCWQEEYHLDGYDQRENKGFLRYLLIRSSHSTGQFLITLVTTTPADKEPLLNLAQRCMRLGATGFIHVTHNSPSSAVLVETKEVLAGQDCILEKVNDLEFELNWRSFFQSNPPAFAQMLRAIRQWLPKNGKLLDLYCGVGTIGLSLLNDLGGELVGVEFVPEAIVDAKRNAEAFGLKAEFTCQKSEEWPDLSCDTLILDPPRGGIHPKLIKRLPLEGPERIIYISCNSARFLEEYVSIRDSYRINKVQMFDFFPQTPHIEMVTLLIRKTPTSEPKITED